MASVTGSSRFRPGDRAPVSGVYRVIHTAHRSPHENSFRKSQTFPPCKQCAKAVRFELVSDHQSSGKKPSPQRKK